jgi:hypothetical protein
MPKTMMIGNLADCGCNSRGVAGTKKRKKPLRAGSHRGGVGESVVLEGDKGGLSGVGRGKPDQVCKVNRRGQLKCHAVRKRKRRHGR